MNKSLIAIQILLISAFFSACGTNSKNNNNSNLATVDVELTYPSEYLPEMDIYLLNTDDKQIFKKRSIMNISSVSFNNVPEGTYVIYAITVEKLVPPESGLGESDYNAPRSKYVSAVGGYSKNPDDWNLLPFKVTSGQNSVSINDWDIQIPQ